MDTRPVTTRLVNTATMIDGKVLPRTPERELAPGAELPAHRRR